MKPNDIHQFWPTQMAAAKALGVDQTTISYWHRCGHIPFARQVQIQRLTGLGVDEPAYLKAATETQQKSIPQKD